MGIIGKIVKHLWDESRPCTNHPDNKALSFCQNCRQYFCKDCLVEGARYYYCRTEVCMKKGAQELDYADNPRFCTQCTTDTNEESAGDLLTINFIGTSFIDETRRECTVCGSLELTKASPLGSGLTYKVIWLDESKEHFISRRLRTSEHDPA
jgi:hypothetical protein